MSADEWAALRARTVARIALGRAGDGLPTQRLLEFQMDHARARDAIHLPLDADALMQALARFGPVTVESQAASKADYIQRPDLGRMLSPLSREQLTQPCDCALVIGDGLSALAVNSHAAELAQMLLDATPDWRWSQPIIARHARVALGDDVAHCLNAKLVVMLIGERPGLSSPDSLGVYITYAPQPGMTRDAQRNCISNIRPDGLPLTEAARRIIAIMTLAKNIGATGISLKEDDALALAAPQAQHRIAQP